ncbi:MAG: molybdate ABC transporter substrate-binding protein [Desulfofundulus sp.]
MKLYVAAGMKKPMDTVIKKFEEQTGAKVVVNYGASGQLWTQIREGQPCDLFYSADWIYIEKAQKERKAAESKKFLKDKLVLVVSKSGKAKYSINRDMST